MANALTYQSEFTGQQMDERFTAVATLTAALEALTGVVAQKYVKPSDGIPSTDMTAAVQASLAKAESAVQSLADYYTKTEVDQLLAAINGMDYVDVSTLPTASASTMGKIYLLGPDSSGYYAYYYTSYDGTSYSWVGPLGTTEISLSNYATKAELNQLDQKVDELSIVVAPLVWIGTSGGGHITGIGDYYFNTSDNKVKHITAFTDEYHFTTEDINPIDNGLYTYDGRIYVYKDGEGISEYLSYPFDQRPTPLTTGAVPESSGTYILIQEHGASLIDAAYTLRKNNTDGDVEEDANGDRIRIVFKVTNPVKIKFKTSYLGIANLYLRLDRALAGLSVWDDPITGDNWTTEASGETSISGWLCVSLKKSDGTSITDAEKTAMLEDVVIKIYAEKSFAELMDNEIQQNKSEISSVKTDVSNLQESVGSLQTVELSDIILNVSAEITNRIKTSSIISTGAKFIGKNILDASSFKSKKIINSSGSEVSDATSSYYSYLIPCHGKTLKASFDMQRVSIYSANGAFISRSDLLNVNTYTPPSTAYFARIQVSGASAIANGIVVYDGEDNTYEDFFIQNTIPTSGFFRAYMENGTEAKIEISLYCKAAIPAVKEYPFWEPSVVTDDYKCTTLGQDSQSIPALNTLGYNGFLSTYFDTYVGKYSNGYEVKKIELGMDSGAKVEHKANPLFSYEFIPKYYNKTVLLSAGMNTCEASTYFGLAYFVKALMEHTEDGMLALYNSTRFIIIPVICPTGISHNPLLYLNSNGVRINKNFSYLDSWQYNYDRGGQYVGEYPDSEVETKILKDWLNKYNGATFYMDCHSDTGSPSGQGLALSQCFISDTITKNKLEARKEEITQFYKDKGYISASDTPTFIYGVSDNVTYPKTKYTKVICGIPALMHEQYCISTAYGSDGHTNNDSYGIKNYVALIRWYCLIMCKGDAEIVI